MIRNIILICYLISIIACRNHETKISEPSSNRWELIPQPNDALGIPIKDEPGEEMKIDKQLCTGKATDFLKLNDKKIQQLFFSNLDSIYKVQYPFNEQEDDIRVEITPKYLNVLLSAVNIDSLAQNSNFEKEVHFNRAPKNFTDPLMCKDKLKIEFVSHSCTFRLSVYNTFLVDPDWCVESMVVYFFKIENDQITNFWREEVG